MPRLFSKTDTMKQFLKLMLPLFFVPHLLCGEKNSEDPLFSEIIAEFRKHSVKKNFLNWKVIEKVLKTDSLADTNEKLSRLLRIINDGHSSIITPDGQCLQAKTYSLDAPPVGLYPPGYIEVESIPESSIRDSYAYIERIVHQICRADSLNVRRWVVDLRKNTGGNFWTMFQAISILLGNGNYNAFGDPSGNQSLCRIQDGFVFQDSLKVFPSFQPRKIKHPPQGILVLTSPLTASAAEALVLALKHSPRTRIAGTATFGATTTITKRTVASYQLRIASGAMYDHGGRRQEGQLFPDIPLRNSVQADSLIKSFLQPNGDQ